MKLIANSATRVSTHTSPKTNQRIADETRERLNRIGTDPQAIARRLVALDREWDIERAIEMNASTIILIGTALGFVVHSWFLLLPLVVSTFLLQHALQGWCPPVPILRSLGFRTCREIEDERHVLQQRLGLPFDPTGQTPRQH